MSDQAQKKILLLDTHEFRRASVARLLGAWASENSFEIVEESPTAAADLIDDQGGWQMVLFSCGAQSLKDRELARELKVLQILCNNVPLVVISDRRARDEIVAALELGLDGFLPTSIAPLLALKACSFVVGGGSFFPAVREREIDGPTSPPGSEPPKEIPAIQMYDKTDGKNSCNKTRAGQSGDPSLHGPSMTCRQQEVLELLCEGQPNKLIARNLSMTEATVKVHVRQIMRKLGADNRTQAALLAREYETIDEDASCRTMPPNKTINGELQEAASV